MSHLPNGKPVYGLYYGHRIILSGGSKKKGDCVADGKKTGGLAVNKTNSGMLQLGYFPFQMLHNKDIMKM